MNPIPAEFSGERPVVSRSESSRFVVAHRKSRFVNVMDEVRRERSRLGRELHAGAGQPLAGIKLNLEMLANCSPDLSAAARVTLARLQRLTEEALQQVRAVSHSLHPPEWQSLSLESALRALVESSGLADDMELQLELGPFPVEPSQSARIAIYRCAQECISNITRHSAATRVAIMVRAGGEMIELRIHDNGRGFQTTPLAATKPRHGMGLVAIREHAAAAGGISEILSDVAGTRVLVSVPLLDD